MRLATVITALAVGAAASTSLAAAAPSANSAGYVQCDGPSVSSSNVETQELGPTPPGDSVLAGQGCASPDGLDFAGDLEAGVVDAITVSLDWMAAGAERAGMDLQVTGTVEIDGVSFAIDETVSPSGTNDVGFGPITYDVQFTLTDLAAELPESSGTRSVSVMVNVPGAGGSPSAGPGFWVWGTTEVPAGVTLHEVAPA